MNNEFILETERLLFRRHTPGDIGRYCAMEMDADVRRYVGGYPRTREASELGLYIAKEYWNRGLATEAGRAFVELGFNELKLKRIVTLVQVENDASVRVLEKLGFEIVATETGGQRTFFHFARENPSGNR